jgi:hypothetical protein
VTRDPLSVFVNAPFDNAYDALLEALVFAIRACGYQVRCALEENDSGDIRLDKLARLIGESSRSIHDLSRIERGLGDVPRFNMPFELGMSMGARRFNRSHRLDRIKIMVREPYRLPEYLSDLGGNDPDAHHGEPGNVIGIVRNFLGRAPGGRPLAGRTHLIEIFNQFRSELPDIAERIRLTVDEVHVRRNYSDFNWCLTEFLKNAE